jgi:NAD(P)-dependent dehydrogenase (short-subunit alcohol dehydrogenase family)
VTTLQPVGTSALVTGGGQGIGLGIAELLADHGVGVTLLDVDGERAATAAQRIGHGRALACAGSVTSADDVEAAFAAAEDAFGRVRILVNNAGNAEESLIADADEAQWDRTMSIHLKGTFLCTRAYARVVRAAGGPGAIVNLSSLNATAATEGAADYCTAKAGISHFTKVAALELAPYGVRVNAVAPGGTRTPMADTHARMREAFVERTPLGRFGEVEDIARVVLFLVSDLGAWITGATLPVDGGAHIRGVHNFHELLSGAR